MTSETPSSVVPDTSCLIALDALGQMKLLVTFYGVVTIPQAVAREFGSVVPCWLQVRTVKNTSLIAALRRSLGPGESEAIALASEIPNSLLVLDDLRARRVASEMGLVLTGTLGLILRAKNEGVIASVDAALSQIERVGFRLSSDLRKEVLLLAGERASSR